MPVMEYKLVYVYNAWLFNNLARSFVIQENSIWSSLKYENEPRLDILTPTVR